MNEIKTIIGVTYFSVLQDISKKYVIHNNGYDTYVKKLFSEDRLDLKSNIFIDINLPSLALMNKEGCSYTHFVLYSKELPLKYKARLEQTVKKYDFVKGIEIEDNNKFNINEYIEKEVKRNEVFAYFNLDDDDLLSIDYLQKIKNYVNQSFLGFNISMSKGFAAYYDGNVSYCRELRFPFINIGQARICERKTDGSILIFNKGNHMKTDENCPTVIDSRSASFFWLKHKEQDTFSNMNVKTIKDKITRSLEEYPLPISSILDKFPILKTLLKTNDLSLIATDKNINLKERKERREIFLEEIVNRFSARRIVLEYKLRNLDGYSNKQSLIIFHFSKELSEKEFEKSGLLKSSIGYYRYLVTNSSEVNSSLTITKPENIFITGMEVMKWGNERVLIDKIQLFQSI